MKKIILSFLVVSVGWVFPGYASQFLSSNITEVTLFSDQALVERSCRTEVKPGLNELLLEITAFAADKDSVTAQVFGHGELVSVQIKDIHLTEFPQNQVQILEEKLQALLRSLTVLNQRKGVLFKKEAFLDSLIDFSKIQLPKDVQTHFPEIEDLKETIAYLGTTLENINQEKQMLEDDIRETSLKIEQVQKELEAVRGGVQKTKKGVEVLYKADQSETIRLNVQYVVKNASWKPLYKVAVPVDLSEVNLTMLSRISQKSGENWKNVSLSISNVIPLKGIRLPELESWVLDIRRPPAALRKPMLMKTENAVLEEMEPADVSAGAPLETAAEYAKTLQRELPFSFEYRMPYPVDIESRETSSILPIFTKTLQGDYFYYTIPKKSALTFLVCETRADNEILAGPLNLYFGGRYIGETYLSEKKPGDPFYLNMGADRAVKVRREKLRDKIKETYFGTLQRDTVVREIEYKISAENLKPDNVRLKIEDNIPVSKTDKIQVKDVKVTPDPDKRNYQDKEGVMLWELQLAPSEKKEILMNFTVTYPADSPPFGL